MNRVVKVRDGLFVNFLLIDGIIVLLLEEKKRTKNGKTNTSCVTSSRVSFFLSKKPHWQQSFQSKTK